VRILLVEDEAITREALKDLLENFGYQVDTAEDGKEAWEKFKESKVRLIVTDLLMPGMDGIELCKKIRANNNDHYTYIIAISGMVDQTNLFDAFFAGADDFIMKPWHQAEVRARLRTGQRILALEDDLQSKINKLKVANDMVEASSGRVNKEIQFMSKIQSPLLPATDINFPNVKLAWKHDPQTILAGDGFNVVRLDEKHLGIYMLDVSGGGPAASYMLASLARKLTPIPGYPGILKVIKLDKPGYSLIEPKDVLERLNKEFPLDEITNQYFTMFYGILNIESGHFKYSTAGHPTPFVIRRVGFVEELEGSGHPVGFIDNSKFDQWETTFEPFECLYLYSDGLVKGLGQGNEPFGKERFKDELKKSADNHLQKSIELLYEAGKSWNVEEQFADDVSILGLEILEG
jgi:sigma-B regulation protein RsbU (phosphoserine phosphatase)